MSTGGAGAQPEIVQPAGQIALWNQKQLDSINRARTYAVGIALGVDKFVMQLGSADAGLDSASDKGNIGRWRPTGEQRRREHRRGTR